VVGWEVRFELWREGVKIKDIGIDYSETGDHIDTVNVPDDLAAGDDYKSRVVSVWMDANGGGPDSWDESDGSIIIQ
jgi:hypothetical protein